MGHTRSQRDSGEDTVECQSHRGSTPGNVMAMVVRRVVHSRVLMAIVCWLVRLHIVVMETKKPLHEKHNQHSQQHPQHHRMRCKTNVLPRGTCHCFFDCMRQHVQQANAQHHARDKADSYFHSLMCQMNPYGNHSTRDRRGGNQQTVVGQQDERRHGPILRDLCDTPRLLRENCNNLWNLTGQWAVRD